MLKLVDIEYSIGERTLFSNINLGINRFDRYALVGANGAGKTTLLRIISGDLSATKGHVSKPKEMIIGHLPQEEVVLRGHSLIDEVLKDFNLHLANLSRIRESINTNPRAKGLLRKYEIAEENFQRFGGYSYEAEAKKVIHGLGFTTADHSKSVHEFSSGWQMRIVLARLLLNKPNLLLLDEPTNHLDIESIQWLENYLQNFNGAMIVVSHDRYFLDKVLQTSRGSIGVFEIDFGQFRKYRTDYTGYLQESQARKQRVIQLAKVQEKKIREIKEFIMRNRANKSKAKLVKSREKYLERMECIQAESERKKIKVRFPVAKMHSHRLVELKNIAKKYNGNTVFENINLFIERHDRIALIGKNGAGKSTLCRIVAGSEKPSEGERKVSEKLKIRTFSHEMLLNLTPSQTVLEEAMKDAPPEVNQNIRKFLGLFLFPGDDVLKKIEVISGGEKTRLVILKAMLEPSNLLILDEPTFHLDKDSVDSIKQAIKLYEGTIILVTHDRDLIASFATRIIEIKDGKLYDYPGDYSYYLWKKSRDVSRRIKRKSKAVESPVERMKNLIIQKEKRRGQLREAFSRFGSVSNPKKSKNMFKEYQRLSEEIEELEKSIEDIG